MSIQLGDAVIRITGDLTAFNKSLTLAQTNAQRSFGAIAMGARQVGIAFTAIGVTGAAAFVSAAKEGIKFEAALADVRKVTDFTDEGFKEFTESIRELAIETPIAIGELLAISTVGGKFNVAEEALVDYTRTMSQLVVVTDLTAEAATMMTAQFKNITGTADADVSKFANTLNALGQNAATTEEKVLALGLRVSAAGTLAGFSEPEILGLAAALSAVGVRSEMGGTQISKMIDIINTLAIQGSDDIQAFSDLAGVSSEQFIADWKEKPSEALEAVILGLQRLFKAGGSVSAKIVELGGNSARMKDVFGRTALAAGDMAESIDLAKESYIDVGSVQKEFAIQVETTESKIKLLNNAVADFKIEIFDNLKPALKGILDDLRDITLWIGNWAKEHPLLTTILSKSAIVVTVLALAIGALSLAISTILIPIASFNIAMGGAGVASAVGGGAGLAGAAAVSAKWIKLNALALTGSGGLSGALEATTPKTVLAAAASSKWGRILGKAAGKLGLIGALVGLSISIWKVIDAEEKLSEMQSKINEIQKQGSVETAVLIQRLRNEGVTFDALTEKMLAGRQKQSAANAIGLKVIEREEEGLRLMGNEAEDAYRRAAEAALRFEENQNQVSIKVVGFWKNILNAIMNVISAAGKGGTQVPNIGGPVPGAAGGTISSRGGMTIVGERGPEIVNLNRGDQVTPAAQSRGMMGGGITINGPLIQVDNVNNDADIDRLADTVNARLGKLMKNSMGNNGIMMRTA